MVLITVLTIGINRSKNERLVMYIGGIKGMLGPVEQRTFFLTLFARLCIMEEECRVSLAFE